MSEVRTVGLLGAGVIGAGWAARCLINGLDVRLYDPDPEAPRKVEAVLDNARRAYRKLTLAPLEHEGRLSFVETPEAAAEGAGFVQESAPERIELKQRLLAAADRVAPPEVVFASSTSGLRPSVLQAEMAHPERLTVGHPFNPVYLMPLVEVCGGARTAPKTGEKAAAFYRAIGMHPLAVRREIDGFIADRLMEALWREALWLVEDDIATAAEIDDAVRFGPGLRWAFMGTFLTYRIAGGEAGMRHFMAQFGPALKWPWSRLTEVPELGEALLDKLAEQSDAQAAGASIRELERLRDDCLVAVMQGLRGQDYGAGAVLKRYEEALYEAGHPAVMQPGDDLSQPLRLHRARVLPEWVDYNGHMTESRYLQVFGDASDALFRYVGIDADYHAAGLSYYTVETHIHHLREVAGEAPLGVTTQILDLDAKRMHLFHSLHQAGEGTQLATAEQMLLHVDTRAGRACPTRADVQARLEKILAAQAGLPRPPQAGASIGIRRR